MHIILIGTLASLIAGSATILGAAAVFLMPKVNGKFLVPYGLAFAAGAMLFVTSEEIIPETHSRGNAREATIGIIFGFIAMMLLENLFV